MGTRSRDAPLKRVFSSIVTIFMELGCDPFLSREATARQILITPYERLRCDVQILGGKVRTEVSSVAVNGAVFHESIALKDIHSRNDVITGE